MDPRRFRRRLGGRGVLLDGPCPRNSQSAVTGGGGRNDGWWWCGVVAAYRWQGAVKAAFGRQGHPSGRPPSSEEPIRRRWERRNRRREGKRLCRVKWKGATAYCEAPPWTHIGSGGVWAAGASFWTAPASEWPVLRHWGRRNRRWGGGGVVGRRPGVQVERGREGGVWAAGASFWPAPRSRKSQSAVAGRRRNRRREGEAASSERTAGKRPRPSVRPLHGPTSVQAAFGRQGHPSGRPLASEWQVRRDWGRRNRRWEGGGVSWRRTGGKGPRPTVRPLHAPTSVQPAFGRQRHPSGRPLASEWPLRRH